MATAVRLRVGLWGRGYRVRLRGFQTLLYNAEQEY